MLLFNYPFDLILTMNEIEFWKCPECGRLFKNKGQFHTCASIPFDYHFHNKPRILREIFDSIVYRLKDFGQIRIDAVKTSINLGAKSHFGMVYVLKDCLKLEFITDRLIESSRFLKVKESKKDLFMYTLKIKQLRDVDEELINWLKIAYDFRN